MKTIRQLLSAAMLLCMCVMFSACPDDPEPPTPTPKFVGVWMGEEVDEEDDDYWLCYQIINADGTGIYQEFYADMSPVNIRENENAEFTWTLSDDEQSLKVLYKDDNSTETWDISKMTETAWQTYGTTFLKQSGYTASPSLVGTWRWDYYDEATELVFKGNGTGTFKYWDNDKLDESYNMNYSASASSVTISSTGSREQMQMPIVLLTFNRWITYNPRGEGIVFKKQ